MIIVYNVLKTPELFDHISQLTLLSDFCPYQLIYEILFLSFRNKFCLLKAFFEFAEILMQHTSWPVQYISPQ